MTDRGLSCHESIGKVTSRHLDYQETIGKVASWGLDCHESIGKVTSRGLNCHESIGKVTSRGLDCHESIGKVTSRGLGCPHLSWTVLISKQALQHQKKREQIVLSCACICHPLGLTRSYYFTLAVLVMTSTAFLTAISCLSISSESNWRTRSASML